MLRRFGVVGLTVVLSACGGGGGGGSNSGGSTGTGPSTAKIVVQPMTTVSVNAGTGYFQDPYPIHIVSLNVTPAPLTFSGTTKALLSCAGQVQPDCFSSTPVQLDPGILTSLTANAGSTINNFEGLNIYQDNAGKWQMAVTAHLSKPGMTDWNVILHAKPTSTPGGVPTSWTIDALLVGDPGKFAPDNYDAKYIEDQGTLYLTYNKQIVVGQDGVVAQAMTSATTPATSDPVPLLGPETSNGGYNSELADGLGSTSTVKLVETGNITKIQGKYVMTYSVGTFNRPDYKAGIAWSDTFLPQPGSYYQRVQKTDTMGLWGQANHAEVQYLLQSQIAQWPNYVASQVLAPGVPAIVSDTTGAYYLTFAGYDPSDAPTDSNGLYLGTHRRPYYVKLNVQIPAGSTVASTSPQSLASWIQPVTN